MLFLIIRCNQWKTMLYFFQNKEEEHKMKIRILELIDGAKKAKNVKEKFIPKMIQRNLELKQVTL